MIRHRSNPQILGVVPGSRRSTYRGLLGLAMLALFAAACRQPIDVVEIALPDGVSIPPT